LKPTSKKEQKVLNQEAKLMIKALYGEKLDFEPKVITFVLKPDPGSDEEEAARNLKLEKSAKFLEASFLARKHLELAKKYTTEAKFWAFDESDSTESSKDEVGRTKDPDHGSKRAELNKSNQRVLQSYEPTTPQMTHPSVSRLQQGQPHLSGLQSISLHQPQQHR